MYCFVSFYLQFNAELEIDAYIVYILYSCFLHVEQYQCSFSTNFALSDGLELIIYLRLCLHLVQTLYHTSGKQL